MSYALINAVFSLLVKDELFMSFLALSPSSPEEAVVKRIIKGLEPDSAITPNSAPQVQIYVMPGRFGRNPLVYQGKFCLDFYAKESFVARKMSEAAFKILHDQNLRTKSLDTFRCVLTYDTDFATGITGVKGYKAIYDVDYIRMN
jgi:hypothetical protein